MTSFGGEDIRDGYSVLGSAVGANLHFMVEFLKRRPGVGWHVTVKIRRDLLSFKGWMVDRTAERNESDISISVTT